MELKDKVKAVRAKLFITQGQLPKELDCSLLTVSRWENGIKLASFILQEKFKKFRSDKDITFDEKSVVIQLIGKN